MWELARHLFITKGKGEAAFRLNSFDFALLDADIANYNHSIQSSIIPPGAQLTYKKEWLPLEGAILPTILSRRHGGQGESIVAALALGQNINPKLPGLVYEHSGNDEKLVLLQISAMIQRAAMERKWELHSINIVTSCLTVQKEHGCVIVAAVLLP